MIAVILIVTCVSAVLGHRTLERSVRVITIASIIVGIGRLRRLRRQVPRDARRQLPPRQLLADLVPVRDDRGVAADLLGPVRRRLRPVHPGDRLIPPASVPAGFARDLPRLLGGDGGGRLRGHGFREATRATSCPASPPRPRPGSCCRCSLVLGPRLQHRERRHVALQRGARHRLVAVLLPGQALADRGRPERDRLRPDLPAGSGDQLPHQPRGVRDDHGRHRDAVDGDRRDPLPHERGQYSPGDLHAFAMPGVRGRYWYSERASTYGPCSPGPSAWPSG